MFRAILAHSQEVLHKQHLVYCVHRSQLTLYARHIPSAVCVVTPEDEKVNELKI
jgi:hypothetical protein